MLMFKRPNFVLTISNPLPGVNSPEAMFVYVESWNPRFIKISVYDESKTGGTFCASVTEGIMVNKKNTKKELQSFTDTCIINRLVLDNYLRIINYFLGSIQ